MRKQTKAERIAYLKKRYYLARRRARYWSGNPFSKGTSETRTSELSLKYELALNDVDSLARLLSDLGVDVDGDYDPKRKFQIGFSKVLGKL